MLSRSQARDWMEFLYSSVTSFIILQPASKRYYQGPCKPFWWKVPTMENWRDIRPSESCRLTSNQSCRPSCSVGLLSVVAKYCMPSRMQVQEVFCFSVSPYQAGWCWHCSSWALAAETMTQPSVSAPRRTIYARNRSRVTAQGPGRKQRLVTGLYQWLQVGLILAYWVSSALASTNESDYPRYLLLIKRIVFWSSTQLFLCRGGGGEVNTHDYHLALSWGTLVKRGYLAVDQFNKAVSVIYVISLAGSNTTQLVTHTWLLFCEHYKPICLFNQLLQHVGTWQRNKKRGESHRVKGKRTQPGPNSPSFNFSRTYSPQPATPAQPTPPLLGNRCHFIFLQF